MIVELVSTGTELLLGQIINTNAPYLAQKLNDIGFDTLYQSTVGDNRSRMSQVLATALQRADIVITSGGLGPTQGDITKEVTANLLNLPMRLHEPSVKRIQCFFQHRNMTMPESNLRQAMMPEGALVVDNERGTAPGVIIEHEGKVVIHLPGPPKELEYMFDHSIAPYLKNKFGVQGIIRSKVLRTFGLGESALEEEIKDFILNQTNPTIALLVRNGEIFVRLTAKADTEEQADRLIEALERQIRSRVGEYIFGVNEETLPQAVGRILAEKQVTAALAESCTGGLATSYLTDVSGSSRYVTGSIVSYSNEVKIHVVGVPAETIAAHGAVSEETAIAMAEGVRRLLHTDFGVGITGIAGPDGGSVEKPIGLVYMAVAGPGGTKCYEHRFTGVRTDIKHRAAMSALHHLRQYALTI